MEKIFEQIKFEIEKQIFKYGVQDYSSKENTLTETDNISENKSIKIHYKENHLSWLSVLCGPLNELCNSHSDYDSRAELIKCAAVLLNWIDCIDRNNRAIAPELSIKKFDGETFMPYGKYKGDKLKMVPANYLLNALENNFVDGLLKDYIIENKAQLQAPMQNHSTIG